MSTTRQRQRWEDVLSGLLFIIALFGIIVLHELGHALTARRYGIPTRDITLLPIGGLARLERMPEDPWQEFWVALAGPAVNVVLAGGLFAVFVITGALAVALEVPLVGGSLLQFLAKLMWVNVVLAVFNLLPAFPMDGGRVLRAFLAMRMDYVRATEVASSIGQGMAFLFGLWGLISNPFLIFIALFVWVGAAQEASMVALKAGLTGVPVRDAMMTEFHVLSPDDSVQRAVELILQGFQHDFPVVENGKVVGVLTRENVMEALAREGADVSVGKVMHTDFRTATPNEPLEDLMQKLNECQCATVPVVVDGELVGLVNRENVGEFLAFKAYLPGSSKATPAVVAEMVEEKV